MTPDLWTVTLKSGITVKVCTHGYHEEGGETVFALLVDASPEEQVHLDVLGKSPSNPARVDIAIARIPTDSIVSITD